MSQNVGAVIRAFIAIELSRDLQQSLDQVSARLKEHLPRAAVRWVAASKIHLTLKFFGDVSFAHVAALSQTLQEVAGRHPAFEFSVGGLGAFPKPQRARVIWVGIDAPKELEILQRDVDMETARLGYPREDRPFSPHLTLGRVSNQAGIAELRAIAALLESYQVGYLGAVRVQSVHLFRSDLKPGGAVYTHLSSASLGKTLM